MARRVFVFGAGASFCTGAPLMATLIDAAERLHRRKPPEISIAEFDSFFNVLLPRLRVIHATSVVDLSNIESVFGLVEMGRLVRRLPGTAARDVAELADATRVVLAQTVELSCCFERVAGRWEPPNAYLQIAKAVSASEKRVEGGDALISFNYDLALDYALQWAGVPFSYCLDDADVTSLPVLKLHGSLNWAWCSKCGGVHDEALPAVLDRDSRQEPYADGSRRPILSTRLLKRRCACVDSAPVVPGIVPPTWNKTQYHQSFSNVWARAAAELSGAEEVFVIGYSLPESDSFFRDLLALGFVGMGRLKRFEVVNMDAKVSSRFRELLGPECQRGFVSNQSNFENWAPNALDYLTRPQ